MRSKRAVSIHSGAGFAMPDHSSEAEDLLRRALNRLSADNSGAFSPQAFSELKIRVSMYVRALDLPPMIAQSEGQFSSEFRVSL